MAEAHGRFDTAEELYDGAPCGYLSARSDGTITRANLTLLRWTGHTREELLAGVNVQDLLSLSGRVFYETHVRPLLRMQGEVHEIQLELQCKGGAALPILLNAVLVKSAGGEAESLRFTIFNITERKRYERELLAERRIAEARARQAALGMVVARALTVRDAASAQLQQCVDAIVEHLDAIEARIWTTPDGDASLQLGAANGVLSAPLEKRSGRPPERERAAAVERRTLVFEQARDLVPEPDEEWLRREGAESAAALPLVAGDRLFGVLAVYRRDPMDAQTLQTLSTTAHELALGLDRARTEQERDALLVTVQRQAEDLRRSRELIETTLRSIGDAVIATDADGRITFINPIAEALTGWPRDEALGVPSEKVFPIINETTRQPVDSPVERALRTGTICSLENETLLVRRDGTEIPVDDSAAPIRSGESGQIIGAVLVFRDVTERAMAERDLRTTRDRLQTVVRNVPLVLFSIDLEGRILVSEGKGLATLGYTPESRVGLSVWETYADVPWLLGEFRRALGGETFIGGGELAGRLFETHFTPTFGEHGQPTGTVGLALDVTERKRHEEMIHKTMEFEQQLLGIVSHDLRNPISAILMGTSLLMRRSDALDEQVLRSVTRIQTSAERASRLVRDLLDFTQARLGGGIRIQRRTIDLGFLVRQVLDEVEASHPTRSVSYVVQGNAVGDWDPDRIAQVVTNLTSNAMSYSPEGTRVSVALRDLGDSVSLEVHNAGDPIPPQNLERLFLPMQRGTSRSTDAARSVGLGLYIVKQIVSSHDGDVKVRSDATNGTVFQVILPRSDAAAPKARSGSAEAH